jgi:hypothetical protein
MLFTVPDEWGNAVSAQIRKATLWQPCCELEL